MSASDTHLANAIRALAMDAVEAASSGHPGMPMGMADVATILFTRYLKFDSAAPDWADRDRFVLSAGHGSMLIYALLHLTGYEQPTITDIANFRKLSSPCAGHPENFLLAGIEATTGPLGQGLAMAIGMGIAERHLNAVFGDELVDHRTWVIAGDGCLMEGINHEAVGLAGHLGLGRLNVLWDDNRITIDGAGSLSSSEDIPARYRASGWHVVACDGHDGADIARARDEAVADPRPSLVQCGTIIGKGAPNKQCTSATHGAALGKAEVAAARETLGWAHEPFVVPDDARATWLEAGQRGASVRADWEMRLANHSDGDIFTARMKGEVTLAEAEAAAFADFDKMPVSVVTRKSSEQVFEGLTAAFPALLGGSADLTGSSNIEAGTTMGWERYTMVNGLRFGIDRFGVSAPIDDLYNKSGLTADKITPQILSRLDA